MGAVDVKLWVRSSAWCFVSRIENRCNACSCQWWSFWCVTPNCKRVISCGDHSTWNSINILPLDIHVLIYKEWPVVKETMFQPIRKTHISPFSGSVAVVDLLLCMDFMNQLQGGIWVTRYWAKEESPTVVSLISQKKKEAHIINSWAFLRTMVYII